MKTIFEQSTRDELINRINAINEYSTPQWGKMNVYQMFKHCTLVEEMFLRNKYYKRVLIGRIIGQKALKNMLKDDQPMMQNAPTAADFKVIEIQGNTEEERTKWISLIKEYEHFSNPFYVHWFFGKMTREQIGYFVYKHSDHHLRQFNS
ncbi:DUF1569 domain-containing protein [Solitalea sp. MAHUQ-68]|uniref:DUF1569 domain-containing protein n=1 Tax=Solitalea agri TaxID=2953739 RepID=A0A9X2EZL4_9SPHI|nr:DUF1569 domain-containing protein [Solitalea agri]MCO4291319.1 DUF1569 domain-containing protein [Solitalea agri]